MDLSAQLTLIVRIAVGFVLGAVLGAERESRAKPAGLRTHMLVAGGSAAFTVAALTLFSNDGAARVVAQIITGIGFLGAGAILRTGAHARETGGEVVGMTTAATVWVAAALGMLAGGGVYLLAVASTLLALLALRLPHKWLRLRGGDADDDD
ncbi:MAG: MgtC/SapB family protein [Thermomicrobiales bacterium]|nr:MgtC/SapB family protein [Thermomicrobiales bacterium]